MTDEKDKFVCREAGENDFQGIADLLYRNNFAPEGLDWSQREYIEWLKWKYRANPDGPARIFIVVDPEETIVGLRVNLPRLLTSPATGEFIAYHGLDDLIDEKFHRRGLYSKLRRFGHERVPATFGFASDVVIRVARRWGSRPVGPAQRWWFPATLGEGVAGKPFGFIAPLVNTLSRFYAFLWLGTCPRTIRMERVIRFEKDFDIDTSLVHGVRSAAYLNWRFIDNPMYRYSAYEFLDGDKSIGYCVYAARGSKAEIYDFVADRYKRGCLRLFVEHCRGLGFNHLRFRGFALRLRKYGFIPRRDSHNNCIASSELPAGTWMLTLGDRDY